MLDKWDLQGGGMFRKICYKTNDRLRTACGKSPHSPNVKTTSMLSLVSCEKCMASLRYKNNFPESIEENSPKASDDKNSES